MDECQTRFRIMLIWGAIVVGGMIIGNLMGNAVIIFLAFLAPSLIMGVAALIVEFYQMYKEEQKLNAERKHASC